MSKERFKAGVISYEENEIRGIENGLVRILINVSLSLPYTQTRLHLTSFVKSEN